MKRLVFVLPALVFLAALAAFGCTNRGLVGPTPNVDDTITSSCVICHIDEATLQAVASPEEPTSAETSGEGCRGELPPLEAWEKVYIGDVAFVTTTHG